MCKINYVKCLEQLLAHSKNSINIRYLAVYSSFSFSKNTLSKVNIFNCSVFLLVSFEGSLYIQVLVLYQMLSVSLMWFLQFPQLIGKCSLKRHHFTAIELAKIKYSNSKSWDSDIGMPLSIPMFSRNLKKYIPFYL